MLRIYLLARCARNHMIMYDVPALLMVFLQFFHKLLMFRRLLNGLPSFGSHGDCLIAREVKRLLAVALASEVV